MLAGKKYGVLGKSSAIHQTKPFRLVFIINNLLAKLFIRQTFPHNLYPSTFAKHYRL